MDLTTMQPEDVFKKITMLNKDRGICGFAASFCFLYSSSGPSFLYKIDSEHEKYAKEKKYKALVETFKKEFQDADQFSRFVASNVFRWTKVQERNIQELKEFALIFNEVLDQHQHYNIQLESDKAVADFFTKIGIALTPFNIQDILNNYGQSGELAKDAIKDGSIGLTEYVEKNPDPSAIIGLAKEKIDNIGGHNGLKHWVFKNGPVIYNHGKIETTESLARNYPFVCNSISY